VAETRSRVRSKKKVRERPSGSLKISEGKKKGLKKMLLKGRSTCKEKGRMDALGNHATGAGPIKAATLGLTKIGSGKKTKSLMPVWRLRGPASEL